MEECLHKIPVKSGDTFFVPGGVPHAMGRGVYFAEVQQPTDITLRTEPALQPAHLSHHKARRGAVSLIDLHSSITSGSIGPVRARQTNACKNVLGSRAARAACAALPLPSNRGAKLSMRSRSHFSKKASASVRVV